MKIHLTRKNDAVHFEAVNEQNISIQMDGAPNIGGENNGARPMELLLMGLGGCAGIDVNLILGKQRLKADDFQIIIEGEREKGKEPSLFESIQVNFKVKGDIPEEKLKRAVDLSMTKYCSVAKTLEKSATITYSIDLNDKNLL